MSGAMTRRVAAMMSGGDDRLFYDEFKDSNGIELDAHTPDLDKSGGGWTEQAGDFDIQSNRATNQAGAGTGSLAIVSTSKSDVTIDAVIGIGQSASQENDGVVARRDSINGYYWHIRLSSGGNEIELWEFDATPTERANTAVTVNQNTDYDVRMTCSGTTIDGFIDDGNKVTYGSASLNQTETTHGIRVKQDGGLTNKATVDNYKIV